jgi:hypothetical protein
MTGAENYYNQILSDRSAPPGIRQRAEMMLSLIIEATAEKNKMTGLVNTMSDKAETPAAKDDKVPRK